MKDDDILALARTRFDECVTAESKNRETAVEALRFCDGQQWPENIKQERELDGRPCLTLNRVPSFIRHVVNEMRQSRPQIKMRAVDSEADVETAEIIGGMIKTIEASSQAESAYDWAAEYATKMGWGYFRISTKYCDEESFNQDIIPERVANPFSIYVDPNSAQQDASDMKYAFVIKYISKEEYEEKYSDFGGAFGHGEEIGLHKEKWFKTDTVRIAEYWIIEEEEKTLYLLDDGTTTTEEPESYINKRTTTFNKVIQYIIDGQNILETNQHAGKYIPIIRVLGEEVNIEGETLYNGMVRDMIDPQRQYNYWRTAATERVALIPKSPYIGARGSFKSVKWRNANNMNYPYLEYDPVVTEDGIMAPPPQRAPAPEISAGIANEIMVAADELKAVTGIYDPGLGDVSNEVSGIAIENRQRKSGVSNFHFMDNLAKAMTYAGRIYADLIPKIYDTPRMINIVKGDGQEEQIKINEEYIDQKTMKPKHYNIKAGKYDAVVDVGPSFTTQRQEASSSMLELIRVAPQILPLIGDLMAKNFDWPDASELAKRLRTQLPAEIIESENPQIKAMVAQFQQQIKDMQGQMAQVQQYSQSLEDQLKYQEMLLNNKQEDLEVKAAEIKRKQSKDDQDFLRDMTDLELKYGQDVPGSAV